MEGAPETGLRATRGGERGEGHRGGSPELLRFPPPPPRSLRFASRAVGGKPERSASAGGGRGEDPVDLYVAADVVCF